MTKYITYLRVSTAEQQRSGLGIDAQRKLVMDHIKQQGGEFVAEFVDYESGKKVTMEQRPELFKGLTLLRDFMNEKQDIKLLLARTDRLARDLHFISGLLKDHVPLIVAGHEHMTRIEWQLHAMIAEHEATLISQRTKQALAAAKARGVRLGAPPKELRLAQSKGGHGLAKRTQAYAKKIMPLVTNLCNDMAYRREGGWRWTKVDYQKVADHLNDLGIKTFRNGKFTRESIYSFIRNYDVQIKNLRHSRG